MKYIRYIALAIFLGSVGIFFFFGRDNTSSDTKNNAGFARGSVKTEKGNGKSKAREHSLFEEDSKFLEFPEVGIEEMDSSDMTPAERERRGKLIIERSKKLATLFPNNSVIPRELSKEEEIKKAEMNQKMANVQNQYLQNEKVSKEDRLFYYKERLKTSKDRLEIFRYALGQETDGKFDESKLEGFLKERYEIFLESEKAYSNEILEVEKER